MRDKVRRWHIWGAVITALTGTALHFLYEASGFNTIAGYLGSVNESTWEHLKLLFWPVLIWGMVSAFAYGWQLDNFITAIAAAALAGMLTITVLFYTYTGVIGYSISIINIAIFYIGCALAQLVSYRLLLSGKGSGPICRIAAALTLGLFSLAFIAYTYDPPGLGIFTPPQITENTAAVIPDFML